MALQLPLAFALKSGSNNKYLRYIHEDTLHGFLQGSGEEVVSPYTKFQVEKAKSGDGQLVHIRSCYNNKYLRSQAKDHYWIVAEADEPEEDQSLWSCTLFEPEIVQLDHQNDCDHDNNNKKKIALRLRHVQLGLYTMLYSANQFHSCLIAYQHKPLDSQNRDVFTVIDWESLVILPKRLAFKGDNGEYLRAQSIDGNSYLQFSTSDLLDPTVTNEVFTAGDGSVRIKSTSTQNFWRRNSGPKNWVWADSNDNSNKDSDTLFWPVKLINKQENVNVVAFRNLGNNNFSKRFTLYPVISCLSANVPTITAEAHLTVKELVSSRTIKNLNFRLTDARIYDQQNDLVVATGKAENHTQEPTLALIPLFYIDTKTSTWNTTVDDLSFTSLIPTTITSETPFIVDNQGHIEVASGEFNGPYQWGKTHTLETTIQSTFPVVVPPLTRVKVSLLATKGSCDIPFDYTEVDAPISLQRPLFPYHKEGGIYTGVSFYNLKHKKEEEPLA